jgi:hypothetical protein
LANPTDVEIADIDGDGDLDIVGTTIGDHRIYYYDNDGQHPPNLTRREIAETTSALLQVTLVDFDHDGDIDVISAGVWFENNGQRPPTFTYHPPVGWSARFVTDLDKDGDFDLIGFSPGSHGWYENLGGSPAKYAFHSITPFSPGTWSADWMAVADFDSDGDVDVLFTRTFGGPGTALQASSASSVTCSRLRRVFEGIGSATDKRNAILF